MNIVLHQPEIPANTGNIGRTCVATGSVLHLIEAGMDYWHKVDVRRYVNYEDFLEREFRKHPDRKLWMATTKAKRVYTEVSFGPDDYLMFGKESAGIPEELLVENEEACIRIPMLDEIRSLNLSNSAAIVLYEALRQNRFDGLLLAGELHRLHWREA